MVLCGTNLNYPITAGSILLFISIIIGVWPSTDEFGTTVLSNVRNLYSLICGVSVQNHCLSCVFLFVLLQLLYPCFTVLGFTLTKVTTSMKVIELWYMNNRQKFTKNW